MSSGKFLSSKYAADSGNIYALRVQPETLTATFNAVVNAAPVGAVDQEVSAKVSKGNRGFGIKPRTVTIRWEAAPTDYDPNTLQRIPVPTKSVWDGIRKDQAVTYADGTGKVVSKSPERVG